MSTASYLVATLNLPSTIESNGDCEHLSVYSLLKEIRDRRRQWRTDTFYYRDLSAQDDSVTRALKAMGIGRNDRVALGLPNGPEIAVAFLRVLQAPLACR